MAPSPFTGGILTSFTTADESPVSEGGLWGSGTIRGGAENALGILSNQLRHPITGAGGTAWWAGAFNANHEAYYTIATLGAGACSLWCRINPATIGAPDGVQAYYLSGTGYGMIRWLTGSSTTIGTNGAGTVLASGDGLGVRVIGSDFNLYSIKAGVATLELTVNDSTAAIQTGTNIGVGMGSSDNTSRFDDLGGGSIAAVVVPTWTSKSGSQKERARA